MLRPYYLAAYFLLFSTGVLGFIDRMIYGTWAGKPGNKITVTINLLAIVVSVLLFWCGARRRQRPRLNLALPLAAAGLLVSSVLWSVEPSMTLTRSIAYSFLIVGAMGVVEILDTEEVMGLVASIGGLSAALSLVLLFVHPNAVKMADDFIGLFSQKNVLGQAMAVGVLAGLHGIRVGSRRRFRYICVVVLCAFVAFLSKSTTSLIAIFVFFTLHFLGILYIKGAAHRALSIFLAIALIPTSILLLMNGDLIFSFLGKDPSLTGRTDLWRYVIDYVYERPLLGWGFSAFWTASNPRPWEISSALGWYANEAHNGMLQLLLDVGFVGAPLFLFLWMRNLVMAVKCMNGPAPEIGVSSLLLVVAILLIGVTEQVLVTVDGLTVLFFLLGFMCETKLALRRSGSIPAHRANQSLRFARQARSPPVAPT
jgi:exopolysaccharide production protein ExoQ